MKNNYFTIAVLSVILIMQYACSSSKSGQSEGKEKIAGRILFYNVENLFDTINEEGHRDGEFTPENEKNWNSERYQFKLTQLSKVIAAADTGYLPNIIGLCEVENEKVIEDLVATPLLQKAEYKIIHKESPDFRGIDVALIHDKSYLALKNTFYNIPLPGERSTTRDLLYSKGIFKKDTLHLFVNHWPSRYGGKEESDPKRA
jgi:hypothetical protein